MTVHSSMHLCMSLLVVNLFKDAPETYLRKIFFQHQVSWFMNALVNRQFLVNCTPYSYTK